MRGKLIIGAGALGLCLATGGCADYLDRRDSLSYAAGNSVASNRIIQTIDPYPRNSFRRGQSFDGVKAEQASRAYHSPNAPPLQTITGGGATTQ